MNLRQAFQTLCTFIFSGLLFATASAGVANGTFENVNGAGFVGWDAQGVVEIGSDASGNFAILRDIDGSSSSFLSQALPLPSDALSLSFDFAFSVNGNLASTVEDSFEATLFNEDGLSDGFSSISPIELPFFGTFPPFYVAGGGSPITGPGVSETNSGIGLRAGWSRVTLDLRGVAPQQVGIDFGLLDGFVSTDADALVDNVVLRSGPGAVIPEPASAATWALVMLSSLAIGLRRQRGP